MQNCVCNLCNIKTTSLEKIKMINKYGVAIYFLIQFLFADLCLVIVSFAPDDDPIIPWLTKPQSIMMSILLLVITIWLIKKMCEKAKVS